LEERAEARGLEPADALAGVRVEIHEWSYNPWRDRPGQAILTCFAALLTCGTVLSLHLPALMALVMCTVVLGSLSTALVPVRCRLDEEGVTRRSGWMVERRLWRDLKRAVRKSDGILLTASKDPHWLDAYRTLFLPVPPLRGPAGPEIERLLASHGL